VDSGGIKIYAANSSSSKCLSFTRVENHEHIPEALDLRRQLVAQQVFVHHHELKTQGGFQRDQDLRPQLVSIKRLSIAWVGRVRKGQQEFCFPVLDWGAEGL
jgi:hypothetical protein